MNLIVEPPSMVGPLCIGMPILEAERLLCGIEGAIIAAREARRNPGFVHFESEMSIQIVPDRFGMLRSVEIYRPFKGVQVLYGKISVFDTPADDLIAMLSARNRLEIEDGGLRVTVPDLLIAFSRDMLEVGTDGVQGRYFESMLVANPGYYDEYEREVWPSEDVKRSATPPVRVEDDGQGSLF